MWILIWLKSNSFTLEKNPKRREKKLQASFEKADREFVATCEEHSVFRVWQQNVAGCCVFRSVNKSVSHCDLG